MKSLRVILTLAALVSAAWAQPEGARRPRTEFGEPSWQMVRVSGPNLHYRTFESAAAGEAVSYLIYLPPDYATTPARRYPVVYWLHGVGGGQVGVPDMAANLTRAIREGKAPPMLVVFVNGMMDSGYADGRFAVETVTIKELIPHIDATYRTIATREGRGIEGFSMGGSGAAKWGFKYPELFGTVSILAGAMRNPADPDTRGLAERDPADSPWLLAQRNVAKLRGRTTIRIVVGDSDLLKETNTKFHELLAHLGIVHEFDVVPGGIHSPYPLYDGLGDLNWSFYRAAFGRENGTRADG